jgi:hypothetical protein
LVYEARKTWWMLSSSNIGIIRILLLTGPICPI